MTESSLLTIEEVDRMNACGDLDGPDAKRLELIRGELREMSPIGRDHVDVVDWLMDWSYSVLDRKELRISIQSAIDAPELHTIARPDVLWLRRRRTPSRHRVPSVLLLIEVADTTASYDTGPKAQMYAEAGVRDYWVVDIPGKKLHVLRNPSEQDFATHETYSGDACVTPLLVQNVTLTVDKLLAEFDLGD